MAKNEYERALQIYDLYRTARLSTLYHEESLRRWTRVVMFHDVLIALSGAGSPIAFWQHSDKPLLQQFWFYLTLISATLAALKPVLRFDKKIALLSELHTQWCDIFMEMKFLSEDMAAAKGLSPQLERMYDHQRKRSKELQKKEPPRDDAKTKRLEEKVKVEIDIENRWLPEQDEVTHA